MKKKMIILLSAMVICLIGIIVWYNVSLNLTDLVPDEVMEIVVFNGNSGETTHITDEQQIQHIIQNLNETVTTMYPLVEPALEEVSDQIIKTQSVENISYQADNQYTTVMLLNAVENALEKAEIDGTVEE